LLVSPNDRLPTFDETARFDAITAWDRLTAAKQRRVGVLAVRLGVVGQRLNFEHGFMPAQRGEIEALEDKALQRFNDAIEPLWGPAVRLDPVRSNRHQISADGVVTDQTHTAMALLLAHNDVDLGDERAVIRFLKDAGNVDGEIIVHSDAATERARELRASDPKLGVA
jgi:hypothetical protein